MDTGHLYKRHGEPNPVAYDGEQFVLFYVGTDTGKDRHHFAIARFTGHMVDVAGVKPGRESDVQIVNEFPKDWPTNDQVFYFERSTKGSYSWQIKTWYANYCWDGWTGSNSIYIETPNGGKNQAWQLYQVNTFKVPSFQEPTKNQVVPLTPSWNKAVDPTPATDPADYTYQTVGSTVIPYFLVLPSSQWGSVYEGNAYYKLERQQRWFHKESKTNPGSEILDFSQSYSKGWSKETSSSFAASVGIEITTTMGGTFYGVSAETSTLSHKFCRP